MKYKRLCIIPARGGSKRLPRKNIIEFLGKPLIAWTIESSLQSSLFDRVCVSTEDNEIEEISSEYGADVLCRPNFLADDNSRVNDVCLHHLREFKSNNIEFEQIFCLYPTAPLRNESDLKMIARFFDENINCKSVIAVTDYSHYPFQALSIQQDFELKPFWPDLVRKRSDELPQLVAGNGSTYAALTNEFFKTKDFYMKQGMYGYKMDFLRSIDIDEQHDLNLLEMFAQMDNL